MGGRLVGVAGWKVENLVTRVDDIHFLSEVPVKKAFQILLAEVESVSKGLQCEVALVFVSPALAAERELWKIMGYEVRDIDGLGVRAWQEAAQESLIPGNVMLFKQLRLDRVLRPL
jgi:dephospho-CoA kinase